MTAAAGNDGVRALNPPATAPAALTIGGIDDHNTFSDAEISLWHSNYGTGVGGIPKPELVAPSIWVVAPVLPGSSVEQEAVSLFSRRHLGLPEVEARIAAEKLITPYYQHVDGTSFAAPLVASTVACMLEANPRLTPALVREILLRTAHALPGVPSEQQGAGALEAGMAVSMALREQHESLAACTSLPYITRQRIEFVFHEHQAQEVRVSGSWHGWDGPGLALTQAEPGVWRGDIPRLPPGEYTYKFLVDGWRWLDDPGNPDKRWDGRAWLRQRALCAASMRQLIRFIVRLLPAVSMAFASWSSLEPLAAQPALQQPAGSAPAGSVSDQLTRGEMIYARDCATAQCHGVQGEGIRSGDEPGRGVSGHAVFVLPAGAAPASLRYATTSATFVDEQTP